jgi:hypothetical protein
MDKPGHPTNCAILPFTTVVSKDLLFQFPVAVPKGKSNKELTVSR